MWRPEIGVWLRFDLRCLISRLPYRVLPTACACKACAGRKRFVVFAAFSKTQFFRTDIDLRMPH
jgi:hypothetical protein